MRSIRICVLGAGAVGKSSITVRFVHGSFYENVSVGLESGVIDPSFVYKTNRTDAYTQYDPTIEDSFTKITEVEQGKPCRLQITDTAGVEQMITLRESVIRESNAFLLVFALDNPGTYHDLFPIVEDIKRIKDTDSIKRIPIILCGNKVDLGFERVFPANFKPTGVLKGVRYMETSAKLKIGVEQAFIDLAKTYIDARNHRRQKHKERERQHSKTKCVLM